MVDQFVSERKIYLSIIISSSILLALAGIFLPVFGLLVAGILGFFATGRAYRYELVNRKRVRLLSIGVAVGTCLTAGLLAGVWQFMLCKLILFFGALRLSTYCALNDVWITIQVGICPSVLFVLVWAARMLFYEPHD